MTVHSALQRTCQLRRSWFRTCRRPARAFCQYCGRFFCPDHGIILPGGQEVCARQLCYRKKADVERHQAYHAATAARNAQGLCGLTDCSSAPAGQCSRCHSLFCLLHLADREELVRRGRTTGRRRLSTCDHCWRRRSLWARV